MFPQVSDSLHRAEIVTANAQNAHSPGSDDPVFLVKVTGRACCNAASAMNTKSLINTHIITQAGKHAPVGGALEKAELSGEQCGTLPAGMISDNVGR